ncbi:MAG: energy-dependent translational throttle protein EttA [Myxococcales bacterium]|nr:energy-dependent translational throttle protein EttA [Myxococcales bacterium]
MPHQYIYTLQHLRKVTPTGKEVIKDLSLAFYPDAKIGVLGANGAGKSTLLRILAEEDTPTSGETWHPPEIRIGYLPQEPRLDEALSVRQNVEAGVAEVRALLSRFDELNNQLAEGVPDERMEKFMAEYNRVQDAIEAAGAWDLDRALDVAMDALRCPPGDALPATLSGGERRRVALCRLLLSKPDLLLLDEPTNHLDAESVAWLEHYLQQFPGTVIAVTHDRYFLDNVAGWILELDRGEGIPWKGNYSSWLEQKRRRLEMEEKQASARARTLARELEWVNMSPRARQAKGKARLNAYQALRAEAEAAAARESEIEIRIPPGPRLGDDVVVAEHISKGYGDRLLIEDLSFRLPPGGIVGVIGGNGAGKTTLLRLIVGQEKPDRGTLRLGETVQVAYVDQSRATLNPENTVWQEISGGEEFFEMEGRRVNSRAYVSAFNFRGPDQQKKVGALSGGERNRVHLAKLIRGGGNLLLLDEPTNDLDVDTLRALEEALLAFPGCAVVVSHDRWFLDRIATHILAFEGDSRAVWFQGNYQDYEADRKRRLGAEAEQPHRVRFKKLTRS